MGSPDAFEHRREALATLKLKTVATVTDEQVAQSFLDQISDTSSDLFQYLKAGSIALTLGDVLFVHGGLGEDNIL